MTEEAEEYLERAGLDEGRRKKLVELGYADAPASIRHHLSRPGGLAEHSANVTRRLLALTDAFGIKWKRPESPYLVGMLHDVCKALTYRRSYEGEWAYRHSGIPGHGLQSASVVMSALGIQLTSQELYSITWHMGAFRLEKDGLAEYDAALNVYPLEIIATHTADMLASRIDERERPKDGREGGKGR